MTVIRHFYCDYCNPERKPESPDDGQTAFTTTPDGSSPLGWWDVPGKGIGDGNGHACVTCMMGDRAVRDDVVKRRAEVTARMTA